MQPPPEQVKSHDAPASQRNEHSPRLHVLSQEVPPSQTVPHTVVALATHVNEQTPFPAVQRWVTSPPESGAVAVVAGAFPTCQS